MEIHGSSRDYRGVPWGFRGFRRFPEVFQGGSGCSNEFQRVSGAFQGMSGDFKGVPRISRGFEEVT